MSELSYQERLSQAQSYHNAGMQRVANTPAPEGQKYPRGTKVWVAKDLGPYMSHFKGGCWATVNHTYDHAFGTGNVKSYCLDLDDGRTVAWYYEHQLSLEKEIEDE